MINHDNCHFIHHLNNLHESSVSVNSAWILFAVFFLIKLSIHIFPMRSGCIALMDLVYLIL